MNDFGTRERRLRGEAFDAESGRWIPVEIAARDRSIRIHGSAGAITVRVADRVRILRGMRNWWSMTFSHTVTCALSDIVVSEDRAEVRFEVGFPFDDPIVLRLSSNHAQGFAFITEVKRAQRFARGC